MHFNKKRNKKLLGIPFLLRYNDVQTEKIIIMTFSNNARFLACMTN